MTTQNLCAVEGCINTGHPQICFYDNKLHHHGCIHYDCGYPKHSIAFRKHGWYYVCDEHYALLKAERATWRQEQLIGNKEKNTNETP